MMNDETARLESEQSIGEMHGRAWEHSVKPFVEAKQAELYAAFVNHPSTDKDGLMLIKLQVNALTSMGDEFQTYINTGKLARQQLEENNDG
tara:strand:+ start:4601 stop:4873 length:273 start_codon:yes stop_codon:yes gene_type:complete